MSQEYTIKQGDTLSELAEAFNTDVSTLQELNSDRIKNIDTIRVGNTLSVPTPDDKSTETKEPLDVVPNDNLTKRKCSIEYVDALYVPHNPAEGSSPRPSVYLLTQEAYDIIEKEAQLCKEAVQGDKETVLANLEKLGVMDQVKATPHEFFLAKYDEEHPDEPSLKQRYMQALQARLALEMSMASNIEFLPSTPDIEDVRDIHASFNERIEALNVERGRWRKTGDDNYLEYTIEVTGRGAVNVREPRSDVDNRFARRRASIVKELQSDCLDIVIELIEDLEKIAAQHAKTISIEEDGATYRYSDQLSYYTSSRDSDIQRLINDLIDCRVNDSFNDFIDPGQVTESTEPPCPEDLKDFYKNDITHFFSYYDSMNTVARQIQFSRRYPLGHTMYRLNQFGFYVKEQCLNESELFNGADAVASLQENIGSQSIGTIQRLIESVNISTLGYYSAYALRITIIKEIAKRIAAFTDLVSKNQQYADYVRRLLVYSEHIQERFDALEALAKSRLSSPILDGQEDSVLIGQVREKKRILLWDEHKDWAPENLNNQIVPDSMALNTTIVECALTSKPNEAMYIRSTCAVIDSDPARNKQSCARVYEPTLPTGQGVIKPEAFKDALRDALGNDTEIKTTFALANVGGEVALDEAYEYVLPWRTQQTEIFGNTVKMDVSGGAQFMRFTYSAQAAAESVNLNLVGNTQLGASLDFASGQLATKFSIPAENMYDLKVPYYTVDNERREVSLGDIRFDIEAVVHGMLAASMKCSNEIGFGQDAATGAPGLRTSQTFIATRLESKKDLELADDSELRNIKAGAKTEVSAFAGAEVGGQVSLACLWKNVGSSDMKQLFKLATRLTAQLGVGAKLILQCTLDNGRLIFRFDFDAASIAGFSGKLAFELHPRAYDEFISRLLDVMEHPSFSRFGLFHESDGSEAFYAFNRLLTVAVAYQLTLTQIALLPFHLIRDMEQRALEVTNAPFVANFINSDVETSGQRDWIKKMPAETYAKLFSVLLHYHDLGFWGNDAEAAERNLNQVAAMTKLLEWIRGESHPVSDNAKKKFENVMQRVGEEIEMELPEEVKWQRYAENIDKIIVFWRQAYSNVDAVSDGMIKTRFVNEKDNIIKRLGDMTRNWIPYKRSITLPAYHEVVEYTSVHTNDMKSKNAINQQGYNKIIGG